jgi:hypothetical protein
MAAAVRLDPSGAFVFNMGESGAASGDLPTGVAVASTGDMIGVRGQSDSSLDWGLVVEQWSPTGTLLWSNTKPPHDYSTLFADGVTPTTVATDTAKHVAVGGVYSYATPWIQIYAMP